MGNLLRENIGLVFNRSIRGDAPEHFFIAKHVVMKELISSKDNCYVAPLFLYEQDQGGLFQHEDRRANITPKIIDWLKQVLQHNKTLDAPTAVFNYTYGVFHSPSYRSRYSEFLKNDFPHLPLTTNPELFLALARIGGELATLHLMESPKLDKHITKWVGDKNPEVEKVAWSEDTVWVDKDQSIGFKSVPEPVWNFHIGGYQVCDKWLKDRKGRKLSKDDIDHYQKIVVALSETIRIMVEIDKVINQHGGWPGAFTNKKGE
jgi:predicted helicase